MDHGPLVRHLPSLIESDCGNVRRSGCVGPYLHGSCEAALPRTDVAPETGSFVDANGGAFVIELKVEPHR
ncbi:MAG: hypothetical protein JNK82_37535 [Myxococcaceae bacterium]|nr:hypothetical protein [Myxococcaceae bacterium]